MFSKNTKPQITEPTKIAPTPAPAESRRPAPSAPPAASSTTAAVPASQPARPSAPSILAADLKVEGNLTSKGELHIDGVVDGDVNGDSVTIGENGTVNGKIVTRDAVVQGTVTGTIRAMKVHLAKSAKVIADIHHGSLCIDEGASFEGQCKRSDDPLGKSNGSSQSLQGASVTPADSSAAS
ncbi:MAG: polymer-forming cytoskeletal protein [Geminicoccaceae bacterium]